MFYNLRKKLMKKIFDFRTNEIRNKSQITLEPESGFVILSQLCDPDINMYLVALTSFTSFMKPKKVVVISDKLTDQNKAVLREHVQDIEIMPIENYRENKLPTGGTWERLIAIQRYSAESYVVQMDADIVVLDYPHEVADAIKDNVNFTMTSKIGFEKMSFINASYLVWERTMKHVQNLAEKAFRECRNPEERLYIRGCSGFTGFAKGSFDIESLIEFSQEIEAKIGKDKWYEWGSEQVSSNYIVANSPHSVILPYEKYIFYEPGINEENIKVYHFIGTHRFKRGVYIRNAKRIIDKSIKEVL